MKRVIRAGLFLNAALTVVVYIRVEPLHSQDAAARRERLFDGSSAGVFDSSPPSGYRSFAVLDAAAQPVDGLPIGGWEIDPKTARSTDVGSLW